MIKKISILFLTISIILFSSCVAISSDFFDEHHTLNVKNFSGETIELNITRNRDYHNFTSRTLTIGNSDEITLNLIEGSYEIYINFDKKKPIYIEKLKVNKRKVIIVDSNTSYQIY
ncbi:MAG: hypothetical protein J6X84_05810 [Treponema sp.]|nr:hypothetical protein [Treponema sp.]